MNKLKQIKKLDVLINSKLEEIESLKTLATKVNAPLNQERVQSSGSNDQLGECVAKIVDLQNEINDDIDAFINLKREVMRKIDSIDNSQYCDLLYKRYFEYKTWECVAEEMNLSREWVRNLHNRALNEFFS